MAFEAFDAQWCFSSTQKMLGVESLKNPKGAFGGLVAFGALNSNQVEKGARFSTGADQTGEGGGEEGGEGERRLSKEEGQKEELDTSGEELRMT